MGPLVLVVVVATVELRYSSGVHSVPPFLWAGSRGSQHLRGHPLSICIGDRLRDLRKRKLLTQEQLADRSGLGIATIVRVERNQVERRGSTIRKLAEALNVEPEELVKVGDL